MTTATNNDQTRSPRRGNTEQRKDPAARTRRRHGRLLIGGNRHNGEHNRRGNHYDSVCRSDRGDGRQGRRVSRVGWTRVPGRRVRAGWRGTLAGRRRPPRGHGLQGQSRTPWSRRPRRRRGCSCSHRTGLRGGQPRGRRVCPRGTPYRLRVGVCPTGGNFVRRRPEPHRRLRPFRGCHGRVASVFGQPTI